MKYVLTHVNIIDGNRNSAMKQNYNIYIDDTKISAIDDEETIKEGYQEVSLAGKYVMPGLINLHVHLFGSGKPSKILGGGALQKAVIRFSKTKQGTKVLRKMVKDNVIKQMQSGVTTIRGVGDFFYSDVYIRDQINHGYMIGPRLLVSGPAITVPGGHGDGTFAMTASKKADLENLVVQNHQHHVDLIKICVTGGVMDAKVRGEPGELKMNVSQTKAVCDKAHELGYKVASHTESFEGIQVALDGGVDTIEHGSYIDDNLVTLFKQRKSSLICTLSPALPLASFSPKQTKLNELTVYNAKVVLDNMIRGVKTALKNRIPVGLGTDSSCPFVTQFDMWREVAYFVKYIGVSNKEAIYTATLGNAKILGIDKITGSIKVGKEADLLIVNQNPLEDIRSLQDIHSVYVKGHRIEHHNKRKNKKIARELDTLL